MRRFVLLKYLLVACIPFWSKGRYFIDVRFLRFIVENTSVHEFLASGSSYFVSCHVANQSPYSGIKVAHDYDVGELVFEDYFFYVLNSTICRVG